MRSTQDQTIRSVRSEDDFLLALTPRDLARITAILAHLSERGITGLDGERVNRWLQELDRLLKSGDLIQYSHSLSYWDLCQLIEAFRETVQIVETIASRDGMIQSG